MSRVVSMRAGEGAILVETDESVGIPAEALAASSRGTQGVSAGLEPVVDLSSAERRFAEVRSLIVSCSRELEQAIKEIPKPSEVLIEFGIKFGGETGLPMLTKLTGEASIQVSITWKPDSE